MDLNRRRRGRYSSGRIARAISQDSGHDYPYSEIVRDPVYGTWVHKSETFKPSTKYKNIGRPVRDVIELEHPLPPDNRAPRNFNPYLEGRSVVGLEAGDLEFVFLRPEDIIYMWQQSAASETRSSVQYSDLGDQRTATDFNETGMAQLAYVIPSAPQYVVIAYHINQRRPQSLYLGQNDFNQIEGFHANATRLNIDGETYNLLISDNAFDPAKIRPNQGDAPLFEVVRVNL